MQNIDLICIGKMNAKYFAEGVAEYQKRLAAFAAFRIIELPEEKIEEKNASDAVVKKALEKEGKAILSNVRKGAAIVAMCIEGRQISSDELAQFLADRANSGAGDVAFVIGSSHGLADEVKRAAALIQSLGHAHPAGLLGQCHQSGSRKHVQRAASHGFRSVFVGHSHGLLAVDPSCQSHKNSPFLFV